MSLADGGAWEQEFGKPYIIPITSTETIASGASTGFGQAFTINYPAITKALDKHSALKYDTEKSPVYQGFIKYFPRAIEAVARVSQAGAKKYNEGKFPTKWDQIPDGANRIADGGVRHMLEVAKGNLIDDGEGGTGCWHLAQEAWNVMAKLELFLREKEHEIQPITDPVVR